MASERTVVLATEAAGLRGQTIYAINLARHLARRGHRVVLATPPDPLFRSAVDEAEWLALPPRVGRASARAGSALVRALQERSPAVIHLIGLEHLGAWQAAAERLNAPVVASVTSFLDRPARYAKGLRPAPLFIAISEDVRANLVNKGRIPKDQVRLVPCGAELPDGRPRAATPENAVKVIATISALERHKGIDTLLRAAARLAERDAAFQLLIMGTGPLERRLRKMRNDLRLEHQVTFVAPTAAYGEFLDDVDVFALPSDAQPLGQTLLEAMAHGKPVVATGTGVVFSVVTDRQDGLIVKVGDDDDLADALQRLLEDDDLRRDMGKAARLRVSEHFGIHPMIRRTIEVYREAGADMASPA